MRFTWGELDGSVCNTRIFIDLHLPRLTHLHDARRLSHVRCVSVWTCPCGTSSEKSSRSPGRVSRWLCRHWCGASAIPSQISRAKLLFTLPSCKADADLTVASCKANADPRSQDSRTSTALVFGYAFAFTLPTLIMQQAFPTFGLGERVSAREEGVNVLRSAHGTSECNMCMYAVDGLSDLHLPCLMKVRRQKNPVQCQVQTNGAIFTSIKQILVQEDLLSHEYSTKTHSGRSHVSWHSPPSIVSNTRIRSSQYLHQHSQSLWTTISLWLRG